MKTKSRDGKHKHKKHKKEKAESTSESSSSESEEEWVESRKKDTRDEWMNNANDSFNDFIPTYSKGGSERKRQKLEKAEAEKLQQKKLLQERELNPYWKNDGCGLPMQKPGDDDDVQSLKLPSKSVGDGGYGWLKKAHERVREQAEQEGRTMEDVAVDRWGSLAKLESMLEDAKRRMSTAEQRKNPSPRMRHKQDYDESRKHWSSKDSRASSDHYHSKSSDYRRERRDDDSCRRERRDDDSCRRERRDDDSCRRERDDDSCKRERNDDSYRRERRDDDSYRRERRDDDSYRSHKDSRQSSPQSHSSSSRDSDSKHRNERYKYGTSKDSIPESRRFLPPEEESREHRPSWRKKDYGRKSPSFEKKEREYKIPSSVASSSHHSSDSSQQPAWKKSFSKASALLENNFVKEQTVIEERIPEVKEKRVRERTPEVETIKSNTEDKKLSEDSMSSDEGDEKDKQSVKDIMMNRNELNLLASRALRAEFWNDFQLAEQIQQDLDVAKATREDFKKSGAAIYDGQPREEIVSSVIDYYRPPKKLKELQRSGIGMQRSKVVHVGALKKQYFDDHLSLKEMFQTEKMTTADDQLKMYFETAASVKNSVNEEFTDDVSVKVSKKMNNYPSEEKDMKKAIQDHKRHSNALGKCRFCWDKPHLLKHTIVGKGDHVFICVPPYTSLAEGHCFIIPKTHVSSSLLLEENEFNELQAFKRGFSKMFFDKGQSLVFMETSINHRYFPHAVIECIPMPKDVADLAPMYFKKAIDECETEWSNNKKLIDLSKKDLRHSVPKGLQFFSVEFSFGGGFAHIVEDEKNFPKHFGKEIVGGMLEIETYSILKAKDEPMKGVFKKALKLTDEWWKYKKYFEI